MSPKANIQYDYNQMQQINQYNNNQFVFNNIPLNTEMNQNMNQPIYNNNLLPMMSKDNYEIKIIEGENEKKDLEKKKDVNF